MFENDISVNGLLKNQVQGQGFKSLKNLNHQVSYLANIAVEIFILRKGILRLF